MLEFALVIPIFVFVLYGLIAFGMMLTAKQTITNAAAEGARAAVGAPANSTAQIQAAHDRVASAMQSLSKYNVDDPGAFSATVAPCTTGSTTNCITVKVTYDYSAHPTIPPAPGLGLVTPDKLSSTAVVQVS
ncbi:MAG: pilus assembly protein [Acidimicrobiia bacterium]|nr:pilus assembly protein [Acidimicrobiia bacterium]